MGEGKITIKVVEIEPNSYDLNPHTPKQKWNGPTYKDCKENPPPLLSLQSYLGDWATPLEYCDTAGTYKYDYIRADLVPQWQPIETAPKDGTNILVHCPKSGIVVSSWYPDEVELNSEYHPTHWMPLPTPPPHDPGEA